MAIEAYKAEIKRFLGSKEAEVLVISGKWGVGKTYAWTHFLREAAGSDGIALNRYAYVSLFGLGDLNDARQAIFESTVDRKVAGSQADLGSFKGGLKGAIDNLRKASGFLRGLGPVADYAAVIERIGFLTVREQIVCIDDLERKSESLDIRDILGLISFLKEQRSCKVVILLNDEQLGDDESEFRAQLEKVADTYLRYQPTPAEAVAIGVDTRKPFHELITKACLTLGIVNIRTIKRLERVADRLGETLAGYDQRVQDKAVHSAALFAYAKAQPDDAPSIEFLKGFNVYEAMFRREGEELPHPEWRELVDEYGFTGFDDFHNAILRGVEAGHFDLAAIKNVADDAQRRLRYADQEGIFSSAWDLYHDSLADNSDEVVTAMVAAVKAAAPTISATGMSSTVSLLRDLGWRGDISALIREYIAARDDDAPFWDLANSPFGGDVRDPELRAAFAAKLASFGDNRDVAALLQHIGESSGWNPPDIPYLAAQSIPTYVAIFEQLTGRSLRKAVKGGLMFRNIINADSDMRTVTRKVEAALRQIARESAINLRRVRQLGVEVPRPRVRRRHP